MLFIINKCVLKNLLKIIQFLIIIDLLFNKNDTNDIKYQKNIE